MSEEQAKLQAGDVVRLKSGGPLMTVLETSADRSTTSVAWFSVEFDHSYYRTADGIPEQCLVYVERPHDKQ